MTFDRLLKLEFNSAFLRSLLSYVFQPGNYYKILFGPMRGFRIWYDRTINYHTILGLWEQDNFAVLTKVIQKMMQEKSSLVFFDIGANIGIFTLFFTKFGSDSRVFSFEPTPSTVDMLNLNLKKNNISNASVFTLALSNSDGNIDFFVSHHHKSSLVKDWASSHGTSPVEKISVRTRTIDSFAKSEMIPIIDFLKIDVEGGGDRVLEGAYQTIKDNRPVILFESHIPTEDQAVIKMLSTFSYKAFRINTHAWVLNPKMDYTDKDGVWGTMLLLPAEKAKLFNEALQNT